MSLTEEMEGRASANGGDNEILARTSIFRFVPQEQQSRLKRLFKRTHYEFGELITKQNDPADAFFVILSGRGANRRERTRAFAELLRCRR